ncbi:acetyl-CoA carboxylase biotin carboxyl carrier protein [bacterium]|nr:acetyl-CoA carboxylase biotin carboxyl carrier protein [bacterium]
MDVRYLKKLIQLVETSGISELEIEDGGTKVRIGKGQVAGVPYQAVLPAAQPVYPAAAQLVAVEKAAELKEEKNLLEVRSPMVGTFYRSPRPGANTYVNVGDRVEVGQTLCILEAMKIMNELESEVAGVVREICVENGQPVEFGQRLFLVDPAGR